MKGIAWDDLDMKNKIPNAATKKLYDSLTETFRGEGVDFHVEPIWERFCSEVLTGRYHFVMIDLLQKNRLVGIDRAKTIRSILKGRESHLEQEFPIFLISRGLMRCDVRDVSKLGLVPLPKNWGAPLIVNAVKTHLYPRGLWIAEPKVFVIARQSLRSFGGQPYSDRELTLVCEKIQEVGLLPHTITIGSAFGRDLVRKVIDGTLTARKIVVLLTPDEELKYPGGQITHMARPNIYMEIGQCFQGGLEWKTIILANEKVAFPSNLGGQEPFRFRESVKEKLTELKEFLLDEHVEKRARPHTTM